MNAYRCRCRHGRAGEASLPQHDGSRSSCSWLAFPHPTLGQTVGEATVEGVVQVDAIIPGDARTASSLGTERVGTGVVIDNTGLVVTIGYLILEASEVTITATDEQPCRRTSWPTTTKAASA